MESAPENAFLRSTKIAIRKLYYILAYGHYWGFKYKSSIFRNIIIFILRNIGRLIPLKWLFHFHEWLINYEPINEKGFLIGVNYIFPELSCTYKKEWYNQSCRVQIRDLVLPAPVGYDSVLKTMYGDYMQLPPEEKRVPQHIQDGTVLPE